MAATGANFLYSDEAINSPETVTINLIVNGDLYVPDEYKTIQDAIDASNDGDRIIVADGTYTGTGNKDIDFYGKKITLKSENGPENCIIDCKGTGRAFYFHFGETSESKVEGFTITNAYAHDGGAVYCCGGSPEFSDCIIKNSSAYFGGAIYNLSDITVKNCFITGNDARNGGGIRGINMKLINCVFSNNKARAGGAIITIGGDNRIVNCNILGNEAYGYDNYGGGIIIAGNYLNHTYIKNCIVRDNIADRGDQIGLMAWNLGEVTLYASYNNIQDSLAGLYYAYRPCTVYWQAGNIDAEPWFIEAGYWDMDGFWVEGDYHLLPDSPCIDAGDPNYSYDPNETDLDGRPRVVGGQIDMGAYEYSPAIPAEVRIVPRTINLTSKGKWITSLFWLPEDYDVADIDPNSVLLEGEVEPEWFSVDEQQQVAIVRFSRSEVQGILAPGEVELTVSGELADGTVFEGTDVIRVIDKGKKKNQPPNVTITKPQDGAEFTRDQTIEIEANAWDIDGSIVKVEFFADGSKIGEDNDGTDGWKNNWYDHPVGSYSLTAKATDNDGAATTSPAVGITVLEAPPPGQASNPNPADGARWVSPYANLSWTAGSGAVSHDVYFGTTSPGAFRGNQTATTFDPGTMSASRTYYWRIDEVNPSGTTTGTVWSFITTGGGPIK